MLLSVQLLTSTGSSQKVQVDHSAEIKNRSEVITRMEIKAGYLIRRNINFF